MATTLIRYTAEDIKEAILEDNVTRIDIDACPVCKKLVGYDFRVDTKTKQLTAFWNGTCGCVSSLWATPEKRAWADIAQKINGLSGKTRKDMLIKFRIIPGEGD